MKNKILIFILATFGLIGLLMSLAAIYAYFVTSSSTDHHGILILFLMGLIFFAIGFIPFLMMLRKNGIKKKLLQNGRLIQAKITSVDYNTSLSVNGRCPFVIHCQWTDPVMKDPLYRYKSDNIWFNPSDFIHGDTIAVYIDQDNPNRYYVDLSFLPKVR